LQNKEKEGNNTMAVNWDVIRGKWNQLKGNVRVQWGKLTDDDLEQIGGNKDKLVGTLQERYGWDKEQAQSEADKFMEQHSQ
jgi:uncharacterized protein YjbJ (UPF0337 family)